MIKSNAFIGRQAMIVCLSIFLCLIFTYFNFAFADGSNAHSFDNFEDADAGDLSCKLGVKSTEEKLKCFKDNGYPYASPCAGFVLLKSAKICSGPRIRIAQYKFSEGLPLDRKLITELGNFVNGQLYNHSQIMAFAALLEHRFKIEDVEISFHQVNANVLEMIVSGEPPSSGVSGGMFVGSDMTSFFEINGKHYMGGLRPGFFEYSLQVDQQNIKGVNLSFPISVRRSSTTKLILSAEDYEGQFLNSKHANLMLNFDTFMFEVETPLVESFGIGIGTSNTSDFTGNFKSEDYAFAYANFGWEALPSVDMSIRSYGSSSGGLSSIVSLSGRKIFYPSWLFGGLLRGDAVVKHAFGRVSKIPVHERIYLGGSNMRGYDRFEVGRHVSGDDFALWGARSLGVLQLDALFPVKSFNELFVGVHADVGVVSGIAGGSDIFTSYGVISEYGLADGTSLKIGLTKSDNSRSFSLSLERAF